jgi:hypothetical protein
MKLATIFLLCAAIQFALIITSQGTYVHNTPFLSQAINPVSFSTLLTWTIIGAVAAGLALGGAFVGAFVLSKPDLILFGGMIAIFISWMTPIVSLWSMINAEVIMGSETVAIAGMTVSATTIFAAFIVSPLLIMMFFSLITWWRTTFEG